MITESVVVKGKLKIELFDEDGKRKDERLVNNQVVHTGKTLIAARIAGELTAPSHMAVGNANTAVNVSQTTLGSELGRVTFDTSARTLNTLTYTAIFPGGTGTGAITEAGIFNASSSGNMLCRTNFNVVNKDVTDILLITWQLTIV